jgi:hypothetical protein
MDDIEGYFLTLQLYLFAKNCKTEPQMCGLEFTNKKKSPRIGAGFF